MYQGCNKTALCSQNQIAEAFLSLLKEKPYTRISVSEICAKAGVSRQTFYSLFSSKENIVSFILSKDYAFEPSKACRCSGRPTLPELSRGFSAYILQKNDFIGLLEKNGITHMLEENLCGCLECCGASDAGADADCAEDEELSALTADFIASGLTAIARHSVKNRASMTEARLEKIIYRLFSGEYFLNDLM